MWRMFFDTIIRHGTITVHMHSYAIFLHSKWMSRFQPTSSLKPFRSCTIGLEMQQPWAQAVLEGRKSIESIRNEIISFVPSALIHRQIEILESKKGMDGVSALNGERFNATDLEHKIMRKGWIIIDKVIEYINKESHSKRMNTIRDFHSTARGALCVCVLILSII
eukprot:901370_1